MVEQSLSRVSWQGELAPLQRRFTVTITYGLPYPLGLAEQVHRSIHGTTTQDLCRRFPIVRVLSPRLELRPDAIDEPPLPHVFPNLEYPPLSALCLFDPAADEWSHDDLVADTTIPWTAQWLACYEWWLATGRWYGGGRPVTTVIERG